MPRVDYNIGDIYGDGNTLVEVLSSNTGYRKHGRFICRCGNEFIARIHSVTSLNTRSCGCIKNMGVTLSPLYHVYNNAIARCYNSANPCYESYGARGIKMSDEFKEDITAFIKYIEPLPNYNRRVELKLELDRTNNDGDYERGNLRWATREEQVNNRRPRKEWKKSNKREFKENNSFHIIKQ